MRDAGKTRKWLRGLAIALPLAVAAAVAQQRLYFVDEAASDSTFVEFRTQLRKAVADRDAKFIQTVIYPGIELNVGGDQGPADFERLWKPDDPKSELWDELGAILALGGSFMNNRRQFCAPYVYSVWPSGQNTTDRLAITAKEVNLHARCDAKAPVVAVLGYDVVTELEPESGAAPEGWVWIETSEGKKGCVQDKYVRSPLDYHACFEKIQGKWVMTELMEED